MVFVDVSSADDINVRSLDVLVESLSGTANLFAADPMAAHDWAIPKIVDRTLLVEREAADRHSGVVADRLRDLQAALADLYAALPKNAHGRLDNGTARYALHRHFAGRRGWSIKGLEPAGSAWVRSMSVTPDVRQITKYIMPAFLLDRVLIHMGDGGKGLDLRWLSLSAATLEHLIRSEMMEYLYSVYRTLGLPTAGARSRQEVDEIILNFMMVFAFGVNLEVSDKKDMRRTKQYLDAHHQGWLELRRFLIDKVRAAEPMPADFGGILHFLMGVTEEYGRWQDRDCKHARDTLQASPNMADACVPFSSLKPLTDPGYRELFAESDEDLGKLGVLVNSSAHGLRLVVPNYVLSQAMCLSTASYYTVCCRNPCEAMLEHVEKTVASPTAEPERIVSTLREAPAPKRVAEEAARELTQIAERSRGLIELHGRPFAQWLHRAFPLECPDPSSTGLSGRMSPKTADEWMADPGDDVRETEALIAGLADALARYTTLGSDGSDDQAGAAIEDKARTPAASEVDRLYARRPRRPWPRQWRFFGCRVSQLVSVASMGFMVALACIMGRRIFHATASSKPRETSVAFHSWA